METGARLLELASMDQVAFRGVVGSLTEEQKSFMESVILAGRQGQAQGKVGEVNGEGREPTIAVRMDFGGEDGEGIQNKKKIPNFIF